MSTSLSRSLADYPDRYFSGWNNQRPADIDGVLASQFHWSDPSLPEIVTHVVGARGFLQSNWATFPDIHFEQIGGPLLDEANGRVSVGWRGAGTHTGAEFPPGAPASGRAFEIDGCDVFTVDEHGRATAIHAYYDAADLARQLGLA
jgi:hypothetical protein